jgi:hypothetical protein
MSEPPVLVAAGLEGDQPRVGGGPRREGVVRALLYHPARVYDDDLVRLAERVEPVADEQARGAVAELAEQLLDEVDIDVETLRRRIGVTFQDFMHYELTAAENVGVGDLDRLTDVAAIRLACVRAGIADTLESLPAG